MNLLARVCQKRGRGFCLALVLIFSTPAYAQIGPLIWQENFDSFDSATWTIDVGDGCDIGLCGWGNQELQWYAENNVSIAPVPGEPGNNALVFQARNESINGYSFTSGKVTSANKVAIQYGLVETRIRVPNVDQGLWPAAWMLGTSTQPWPNKGEIDMMEMGHRASERERQGHPAVNPNSYVGANLIFWAEAACVPENPTCAASTAWDVTQNKPYVANAPMNDRFVIYRTYWTDTHIRFTVEDSGVEYDLYESPFVITPESNAFQAPFYLLLNMAVGGNFTDAAVPSQVTAFLPASMYIDYVRVYQYNGQGQVFEGNVSQPETGHFGVFTDNTPTNNRLEAGVSSDIYVWDPFSTTGSIAPFEGGNVIATAFNSPNNWFGGGVQTRQPRDMSNFADGNLRFMINIPPDIAFRIGVTDTFTNEHWLNFPPFTDSYGLTRDGNWGEVTIPISDLRGPLIALQSMQYLFAISSDPTDFPNRTFEYAIDDIVWESDSVAENDADNDGVVDSEDQCPNTPAGTAVDAIGCPLSSNSLVIVDTLTVSQSTSNSWTSVNFPSAFATPPIVVMGAPSYNGVHPLTVRVRNVSTNGFEFQLDEWNYLDGGHTSETLSYIALAQGNHEWGGLQVSAGQLSINGNWQAASFPSTFESAPVVLAQQVSSNSDDATTVRVRNVNAAGVELRLQEEEGGDGLYMTETVSYVAIEKGAGVLGDMNLLVADTGRTVTHNWYDVDFNSGFSQPQFLAGMQSAYGGDTATVRYASLSTTGAQVKIEEETSQDSETAHTREIVGWVVFGNQEIVDPDSDNDGVPDSVDQCPNTAAGAEVDANGCEISNGDVTGIQRTGVNSAEFFVNTSSWADVHYRVNAGPQLNVRMTQTGNQNVFNVSDLVAGDQVQYFFTYWDDEGGFAVDTPWSSYSH